MIGTPEQDAFINKNRWGVVTSLRKDGSPTNSVIFYAREGDELIFSTTLSRLKATTLMHDPRIALTVLDEGQPFGYVTIEGTATVQQDDIIPPHIQLHKAMRRVAEFNPTKATPSGSNPRAA
jgi:PPOX class probable F420-dependent enzyme